MIFNKDFSEKIFEKIVVHINKTVEKIITVEKKSCSVYGQ